MRKVLLFEAIFSALLVIAIAVLVIRKPVNDVPLEEIGRAFEQRSDFSTMEKFSDMRLRRNLSLDAADLTEYLYYGQSDTMAVQVFFVAKCPGEDSVERTLAAVETYLEREKKAFEGYGISQTALLNDARVIREENYVAFIVSNDASEWESQFRAMLEE